MNKPIYTLRTLNTSQLIVPRDTYQREAKPKEVTNIVNNFDERIANEPKVSSRDGSYYVFDGQHTIAARKMLNDNKDLNIVCKVYYGLTEKKEAHLFSEQTGESSKLSPGAKLRADVFSKDPEALAFIAATEATGFRIDYDQNRGERRIGCVSTALDLYRKVGANHYKEGLRVILIAWGGEPESLRSEILRGVIQFVDLYYEEYDPSRLIKQLQKVDPLKIYREGRAIGNSFPGSKKYVYEVLKIYNGKSKTYALPLKF